MAYEIKLEHRTAKLNLLNRAGSKVMLSVDDRNYDLDIVMVEKGVYSILYNGQSYNVELIEGSSAKEYVVNTFARSFTAEIIDAESKYQLSRKTGTESEGDNNISSPMPGKIVKIPVAVGDKVTGGQTLIVVEAMKMQSEFKASTDRTVREILVKEGDIVNAHQVMLKLE
jgi:biotin carboxyl carrier protein